MKAMRFHAHGDPTGLKLEEIDAPAPPGPGDVTVEVKASSVNHLDLFVLEGMPGIPIPLPHVPGSDVAGIVTEVGPGVRGLAPGDRVVADPGLSCSLCEPCSRGESSLCLTYQIVGEHTNGAWTERVVLPARNLYPMPAGLTFEEAGSIGLVFLTAWRMIITRAAVRPGEDVLILGAGSGVGTAAVQIARLAGARVIATASTAEKRRRAEELGAEITIDYTTTDFDKEIRKITGKRGVDVVIDHVGQATWPKSLRSLARDGRLVTCGSTSGPLAETDLRQVFFRQLRILGSTMGTRREFADMMRAFERKQLRPVVDSVFPLERAPDALRKLEGRDVFGKIVIVP